MQLDYQKIYEFDENFETSLKAILVAAEITAAEKIHKTRGAAKLPATRIDVQFTLGTELGHYSLNPSGDYVPDAWNGTLKLGIIADRTKAPTYIKEAQNKLRHLFAAWKNVFNASLPYYRVYSFKEAAPAVNIEADEDRDVCILSYSLIFGLHIFWNDEQQYTASCGQFEIGDPVTVTVPAATFFADSKAEANALALAQATEEATADLVCSTDYGTATPEILVSSPIHYFGGAQSLPAGIYIVTYVHGAIDYSINNNPRRWTINKAAAPLSGYRIRHSTNVTIEGPVNGYDFFSTQAALEAYQAGASVTFEHTGGQIGMFLFDDNYPDNIGTNPRPTFRLNKLP
jgi:hypothetical protein